MENKMNIDDANQQPQYDLSSVESYVPFVPMTPETSEVASIKGPRPQSRKSLPTKTMMQLAIKALPTNSRKGFSLARIRKYILQNFVNTANNLKYRRPIMNKLFKAALETGEIVNVKGTGLNGSFRVPSTSSLHKNTKEIKKQNKKQLKRKTAKEIVKHLKTKQRPALKPKKVKNAKRTFSAQI